MSHFFWTLWTWCAPTEATNSFKYRHFHGLPPLSPIPVTHRLLSLKLAKFSQVACHIFHPHIFTIQSGFNILKEYPTHLLIDLNLHLICNISVTLGKSFHLSVPQKFCIQKWILYINLEWHTWRYLEKEMASCLENPMNGEAW